jgi:hypothetical protein
MRRTASRVLSILDRTFGQERVSLRGAMAALLGLTFAAAYRFHLDLKTFRAMGIALSGYAVAARVVLFLVAALGLVAAYRYPKRLAPVLLATGIVLFPHIRRFALTIQTFSDPRLHPYDFVILFTWGSFSPLVIDAVGIALTLLLLMAHRAVLRKAPTLGAIPLVALVVATCAIPQVFWIVPYSTHLVQRLIVDGIVAGMYLSFLIIPWVAAWALLFLHALWWPVLARPVYAAARFHLVSRKWLLLLVGIGLLASIVPGLGPGLLALVQRLLSVRV